MKHILLSVLLCLGTSMQAEKVTVSEFLVAGPYELRQPVVMDSTNVKGEKFDVKRLLQSSLSPQTAFDAQQVIAAGSEGLPMDNVNSNGHQLGIAAFYLNSDRYTGGKLTVTGPKHIQVYVDGKKKSESGTVQLVLEPRRYKVAIKYLYLKGEEVKPLQVAYEADGDAEVTASANPEKRYTMKEAMDGKRLRSVSLSHDGRFLLKSYSVTLDGGSSSGYQQLTDRKSGAVILNNDNRGLSWMPTSNLLYYTEQGLNGRELITLDPSTLEEKTLAQHLPNGGFSIAPTEDYLIYSIVEEGPKEKADLQQILVPDDRQPGWRNRFFLHKYDLATGVMQQLTFGYRSTYLNDISADGTYLLFTCSEEKLTERPFAVTTLYKMNVKDGTTETLFTDKFINYAKFSDKDQNLLVISASGEAFEGVGLNINEGQTANMGDGQLYTYRLDGEPGVKHIVPCTKDFDPAVKSFDIINGTVYVLAEDKDWVKLYSFDPENMDEGIKQYPLAEQIISNYTVAADGTEIVYYGESDSNAQRLHEYKGKGKKATSTCIEDLSKDLLKDVTLGKVTDWNFKAAAGDTIYGRFYLPPHFDPNKKYPLIVNYYGGTSPTERSMENRYASHVYAAQGYVVYIIQPSGATGFGQEFSARHVNAWGIRTADEIIEGTKLFCKEHSFVDANKIGCIGASYGGFMTQLLQTKTDIFASAISHAGISDITSYWGEGYWGYSYSALASADRYPWNAPKMYTEQSPLFNADKINTPLLFLHGTVDTNVPIGESIQMFTALKLLGKETAFVQVTGQNHQIMDYDKRLEWNKTIFAWFAKWLKNQPEWWNALYPEKKL